MCHLLLPFARWFNETGILQPNRGNEGRGHPYNIAVRKFLYNGMLNFQQEI